MRKRRTSFFGEIPDETPKKNGHNRLVPDRRFERLPSAEIDIRFNDTTATQFGGYPLWDQFLRELNLNARLAQHIKMDRGEGFTAPEVSRFFIDTRILGAATLLDVDPMRHDPILIQIYGIDGLPSDETLGRYFKSFEQGHQESLDRLNVTINNRGWKRGRKRNIEGIVNGDVILDYDSTTMTTYGDREGADRGRCFRKKDKEGFQPKFAFIGGLGIMINQHLYGQSVNLPKDFMEFHEETMSKLPSGVKVRGVRGDGALYSEERVEWCETKGYVYAFGAPMNHPMLERVAQIPEQDWLESGEYRDEYGRPYSIARITYKPPTWKKERTYIISRRFKNKPGQPPLWEGVQYKYFAYVTCFEDTVLDQYKFCVERCSLEGFIKEGKLGFHYDHLPHEELSANQAYLSHVQMSYNLGIWFKLFNAPAPVNRWTVKTLRQRILNVCGNLTRQAGKWILSLPVWWPWKTVYQELARACGFSPG